MWNMRKDAEAKKVFIGLNYGGNWWEARVELECAIPNPKVRSINSPWTLQLFSLFELDVGKVIENKVTSSPKRTEDIWKPIPILFPLKSRLRFHPSGVGPQDDSHGHLKHSKKHGEFHLQWVHIQQLIARSWGGPKGIQKWYLCRYIRSREDEHVYVNLFKGISRYS